MCTWESADADLSDTSPGSELIINHLNQNHCGADGGSDSEGDLSSGPADPQENHTEAADPRDGRHREEQGNGQAQAGEPPPRSEAGAEGALVEEHPARYLSAVSLKKRIHTETTKVNNELRALITKEIRKPGRRTWTSSQASLWIRSGLILLCLLSLLSDYEKIFLLLKQIQGTLDTRLIFLQNIIKEAAR